MTDTERVPSRYAKNTKATVSKRIPQTEALRRGNNIPSSMDMYLAGYIDAHYDIKDDLDSLVNLLEDFDRELRELRLPTCYECGEELGEDWKHRNEHAKEENEHPADCPNCGENPLPPVGGESA